METAHPNEESPTFLLLNLLSLSGAALAAGLWYARPDLGFWPLVLAVSPWGVRLVLQKRLFHRTPYDWALLFFLLTAGLSVWAAYDRPAALAKFWLIVAGIALFYAFSNWTFDDQRAAAGLSVLITLFGAGLAVYFLAVNAWDPDLVKLSLLNNSGPALQPAGPGTIPDGDWRQLTNAVGGILAVIIPFSILPAWWAARQRIVGLLGIALALVGVILIGLFLSDSRSAWLAVAMAVALTIWWKVAGRLTRHNRRRQRGLFAGSLVAGCLLFGVLWVIPAGGQAFLEALPGLGNTGRVDLYRDSLVLVQDYPVIGGGLNAFTMLHASYAALIHVPFSIHSHNLYLDVAIEQGLPGLFALLWLWIVLGLGLWHVAGWDQVEQTGRSSYLSFNRIVSGVAGLAIVIMAVHGLFDDELYGSQAVCLLFLPLSFTTGTLWSPGLKATAGYPAGSRPNWRKANLVAGGLAGIGLLFLALLPAGRATWLSNLAAIRQSQLELSVYSWPEWPIQDELRRQLDIAAVIAGYERALMQNPNHTSANRRLGMIELSTGEYAEALGHLSVAHERASWDNATRQLLGEALIANGRVSEGSMLWQNVSTNRGQLELRRFWYEHIQDEQRLAWIEEGIRQAKFQP